ncbi:MAG: hydroxymethylglutaryl-CoA synthase family protein [Candidatus Aenigmarchaeota archaeon]|nr:hydroxymethylglutaryl-CoA synthase family protein [Candidatus Aenigmarchaeota archaeon]
MPSKPVGIEAMYVYTPQFCVTSETLANARGAKLTHFTEGIGIGSFSFPPPNEDHVSMAATAALRLMKEQDIDPRDIARIDLATESSREGSRGAPSDVVGALEQAFGTNSFRHVAGVEYKFACIGGVEALRNSCALAAPDWLPEGRHNIVIATDFARYHLRSGEEPTQGAAAAALLIGRKPRLLEIVPRAYGSAMRYEPGDFSKPGGRSIANVNGGLSVGSYLSEMRTAWSGFIAAVKETGFIVPSSGMCVSDSIDKGIWHNPHLKQVQSAHASLLMHEWIGLPSKQDIFRNLGTPPERGETPDHVFYASQPYKDYRKRFMKEPVVVRDFDKRIKPSTVAPFDIGNSYSASVFVGIDSLFETDPEDLAGKTVVLAGYGSGSHALIQATRVPEDYMPVAKRLDLMNRLKRREHLSIGAYETWHDFHDGVQSGLVKPSDISLPRSFASPTFVLSSVGAIKSPTEGQRTYALVA